MTELASSAGDKWSRPKMQRQELGPMLHDLGHVILDTAERRIMDEVVFLHQPDDSPGLEKFAETCIGFVAGVVAENEIRDGKHQIIDDLIQSNNRKHSVDDSNLLRSLTHYDDLSTVLREGIESGIVSPLQLYRVVKLVEGDPMTPKIDVSAEEAAERIVSDSFQTMLHQQAASSNGALGAASNKPYTLREEPRDVNFVTFNTISHKDIRENFAFDENGVVIGFSRAYLDYKKQYDAAKRKANESLTGSGGCPVRHTNFPALGEQAKAYFEVIGTPDGQPRNQGESLVARASRFVSAALLMSVEGAQA